jgi:hypothetical protein
MIPRGPGTRLVTFVSFGYSFAPQRLLCGRWTQNLNFVTRREPENRYRMLEALAWKALASAKRCLHKWRGLNS